MAPFNFLLNYIKAVNTTKQYSTMTLLHDIVYYLLIGNLRLARAL